MGFRFQEHDLSREKRPALKVGFSPFGATGKELLQMLSQSTDVEEEGARSRRRRIADTGNRKLSSAGTASRVLYNRGSHLTAAAAHAQKL